MDALWIMLKNVLIFVALALPGFILIKAKLLKTSESAVLSKLLTFVGMPFLILSSTLGINFDQSFAITAIITAVSCIVLTVAVFLITLPLTAKESDEKKRGMMRFSMTFSNNGFLGIPLAMAVFGATSPVVSIVIIFNIFNNMLIYTLGIYLISGDKNTINLKKAFLNPVLIAFVIGLIVNLVGVKNYVPEISTFSDHLKNLVTPISMIILGIKLADVPFKSLFTSPSGYYVSAIKLIALTVVAVAMGIAVKYLFALSNDIVYAFFIAFAMPTAGLSTTFADQFKGDTKNSVIYTLGSTIFSIITIPILYYLLNLIIAIL
ncbi:MAG: AEC family transporter [Clostridia bacterium]|nr:AEC family transporter [Clostridia bacterium]